MRRFILEKAAPFFTVGKKMISHRALMLATAIGVLPVTQAVAAHDAAEGDTLWSYTKALDSVEGYAAFIDAQGDNDALAKEAKVRAIGLLGQLGDLDIHQTATVSGSFSKTASTYEVADLPYGRRSMTFVDVYVDETGMLVNKIGDYISPTGQTVTDGAFQITEDG